MKAILTTDISKQSQRQQHRFSTFSAICCLGSAGIMVLSDTLEKKKLPFSWHPLANK